MFLIIMFAVIGWTGYTAYMQSGILDEKAAQLKQLREEEAAAKQLNAELAYKANRLNDKEYVAELARKQYFMTKPGEILYVIPEN
ncbi:FtsB family cell division protein [Brevibacillus sp. B_LB10_24]|uniref:FtsB family cell division protein n=1 Tax=Brevibacillus sp. B_LB10_24 TaxID=3380645 RepID=UPI0038BD2966